MYLKQIRDFDANSGEADVIVSDGNYDLLCYYHPAEIITSETIINEISALLATDIMRVESKEYLIRKNTDYYSYYLQGKVIDKQKSIIGIGGLRITLNLPLPKDIEQGEFIEFRVERLNI